MRHEVSDELPRTMHDCIDCQIRCEMNVSGIGRGMLISEAMRKGISRFSTHDAWRVL